MEASTLKAVENMTDLGSMVETYDVKLVADCVGNLDIRLQFVGGKPEVVIVKKNEDKLLVTDVLCLHRYA